MNKRNLASILWFVAGWQAGGLLVGIMGLPWFLAFTPGIVMVALVRWDPTGIFSARSAAGRRVRPINEVAAELDRSTDQWSAAETNTRRV